MIELFTMRGERIERIEHEEIARTQSWIGVLGKGTIWVRCYKPNAEDIEAIAELTKIPIEELKEAIEENERPKVHVHKHIEIVYRAPAIEDGDIVTSPIYIYAIGQFIVTIEKQPNKVLSDLATALLENKRRFLFKKAIGYFIFYILDKINDEYLHNIDKISIRVDMFKDRNALNKVNVEKVYNASISLSYFNQALVANLEVLNELRKSYFKMFDHEDRKNFAELYYDALQILDTEKIQRELLSNLINMHSTIAGNELNYFMKIVALVALLTTFPTFIMNLFAMNVKNTPFVDHANAFWWILGAIIFSVFISYFLFKKFSE